MVERETVMRRIDAVAVRLATGFLKQVLRYSFGRRWTSVTAFILALAVATVWTQTSISGPPSALADVSSAAIDEGASLAVDGLTLYFTSTRSPSAGSWDLWRANRPTRTQPFAAPVRVAELSTAHFDGHPSPTPSGNGIFFDSTRHGGPEDIYFADLDPLAGFVNARQVSELNSPDLDAGSSISLDESVLIFFSTRPGGHIQAGGTNGQFDLWEARWNAAAGQFDVPVPLIELNSQFLDAHPGVSPNGLTVYFESQRPEFPGDAVLDHNIWVASRADLGSPFSAPVLLAGANSAANDRQPSVSFDGTELYFSSDRNGGSLDLWVASLANTQPGSDVSTDAPVNLPDGSTAVVGITFESVGQSGSTTVNASSSPSGTTTSAPPNFKIGQPAVYYDVSTTATFSGVVQLCFSWQEGQYHNENAVKLFHFEGGNWVDITTSRDTTANVACGQTSSLSPFGLFETAYTFTGFFQPVDNPPTRNVVNPGAAVPLRFILTGALGLAIFEAGFPASQQVQCDTFAPLDEVEETVSAGNSTLTVDPSTGEYSYVWKTEKGWTKSCRRLLLQFNDGSSQSAVFTFK